MPHMGAGCMAVYSPTDYVHPQGCICVSPPHPHQGCVSSMGYETYYDAQCHGNFAYYPAPHEPSMRNPYG